MNGRRTEVSNLSWLDYPALSNNFGLDFIHIFLKTLFITKIRKVIAEESYLLSKTWNIFYIKCDVYFLAPSGVQGMAISNHCPSVTVISVYKALNLHLSCLNLQAILSALFQAHFSSESIWDFKIDAWWYVVGWGHAWWKIFNLTFKNTLSSQINFNFTTTENLWL